MVVGDDVGLGPDGVGAEGAARTSSKWRRCCATSDPRHLERHQRASATRRMIHNTICGTLFDRLLWSKYQSVLYTHNIF